MITAAVCHMARVLGPREQGERYVDRERRVSARDENKQGVEL